MLPPLSELEGDCNPTVKHPLPTRKRRRFERRNSKVGKMFFEAGYYLPSTSATELEVVASPLINGRNGDDEDTTCNHTGQASSTTIREMITSSLTDNRNSKLGQASEHSSTIYSKHGNVVAVSNTSVAFVERILQERCNYPSLPLKRKTHGSDGGHHFEQSSRKQIRWS